MRDSSESVRAVKHRACTYRGLRELAGVCVDELEDRQEDRGPHIRKHEQRAAAILLGSALNLVLLLGEHGPEHLTAPREDDLVGVYLLTVLPNHELNVTAEEGGVKGRREAQERRVGGDGGDGGGSR